MFLSTLIEAVWLGLFFGIFDDQIDRWKIRYLYSIPLIFLSAYFYARLTDLIIPFSFSDLNLFIFIPTLSVVTLFVKKVLSFFPRKIQLF